MNYQAIIFDMDGLMIDSERLYIAADRQIAAEYGKEIRETTLSKMMGRKPIHSMTVFARDLGLSVEPEKLLARRDVLMLEKFRDKLICMKGLDEIIDEFAGVLKYAVATGAAQKYLDIVVEALNLDKHFSVFQNADSLKKGKPAPDIYLETCRKLNLPPEKCIVLEDSSNGARSGKDAGCYVIAVPNEFTKNQDFSFVDFIANDLRAAGDHIKSLL